MYAKILYKSEKEKDTKKELFQFQAEIRENIKDPELTKCKNKTVSYFQPLHNAKALNIYQTWSQDKDYLKGTAIGHIFKISERFKGALYRPLELDKNFLRILRVLFLSSLTFSTRQTGAYIKKISEWSVV